MKDEFFDYLKLLGMSEVITNRVDKILTIYNRIFEIDVEDIFISEYIKEDKERVFENLWLFNPQFAMEAKNFVNVDDFDLTTMKNSVAYWQIKKQNYDFKEPNEKSRLSLLLRFLEDISGDLKASKENCTKLMYIFQKYIKPNPRPN